jgi:outer membrane lipoprotein LolB
MKVLNKPDRVPVRGDVTNLFVALLLTLLPACSLFTRPKGDDIPNAQVLNARGIELGALQHWWLNGRISIATDVQAWSGKLSWRQNSVSYLIHFNAPTGQGAIQLSGDASGVEFRSADGTLITATDADALLREQTGWRLPISGIWYWVRGLAAPDMILTRVIVGEDGNVSRLEQDDWEISLDRYQMFDGHLFPKKITVENQDLKVRVVVDLWAVS